MEGNNQPNESKQNENLSNESSQPEEQKPQAQEAPKTNQETSTSNVQTNNPISYNNYSQNANSATKKKGKGGLIAAIVIVLILIIAIAAGLIYFFGSYQKADQVYKRLVSSTLDSYSESLDELNYETLKSSVELSANVDLDDVDSDNDIIDLINNTNIAMDVQLDTKNKQFSINLDSEYNKKDLLNFEMFLNVEDEETYLYLKDFLDKYIEVDLDADAYESMAEIFDSQKQVSEKKESIKKAMNIIKKEITGAIKPEYCSSEKAELTINGKKVNTTKNTIKMNEKQFASEVTTILKNLKDNKEFLDCFEDNKDDVEEMLEDAIDELDYSNVDEDSIIEISIYMNGFINQEVVKVDIMATVDDEKVAIAVTKIDDNNCELSVSDNDEEMIIGTITVEESSENKGTVKIALDIEEVGKINLKVKYDQKINEKMDTIDVSNSVKMDELTQEDQQTMLNNLQKSELYSLIEKFSGSSSGLDLSDITGSTINDNSITTQIDTTTQDDTNDTLPNNQIISYDDIKITYGMPAGYTFSRISENYITLAKDSARIVINSAYNTADSYYQKLESYRTNYQNDDYYTNVSLTNRETMQVNGNTFYYATLSYQSKTSSTQYKTKTIWAPISDTYLVVIEINDREGIVTDEELNQILTMTFEDN